MVGDATKEESDEEDDEDEESGRLRFKSERKDSAVVRLSDSSKRRSIPETLGTVLSPFLEKSITDIKKVIVLYVTSPRMALTCRRAFMLWRH